MTRLPIDEAGVGGWPVMTVGVITDGATVHRPTTSPVYDDDGKPTKRVVSHPACMSAEDGEPTTTRAPRFPVVSARWADHAFGVVACTAARCFPER